MGNRVPNRINSLSSYIDAIFRLRREAFSQMSSASYWFFRGQSSAKWSMRPNIFRDDALLSEYESVESALRQRPYDFRECSTDFEILTKLQHYGLGTRLLDVTLNPLVALYFATEPCEDIVYGRDGRGKSTPQDGKIVYKYGYGHKVDELNVRICCALPFLKFENTLTLRQLCDLLRSRSVISESEYRFLSANSYAEFIKSIQANSFVISSYSNERLMSQSGAFIISAAVNVYQDDNDVGNCHVRKACCDLDGEFEEHYFIVPHDKKEQIRDELDFLNINEATLFPELEHQLAYLKNKKSIRYDAVEAMRPFIHEETEPKREAQPQNVREHDAAEADYEPRPDVKRIVSDSIIDEVLAKSVSGIIEDALRLPDWWCRDSILSQITRDITRTLQDKMPMSDSKSMANSIVEALKKPGADSSIT